MSSNFSDKISHRSSLYPNKLLLGNRSCHFEGTLQWIFCHINAKNLFTRVKTKHPQIDDCSPFCLEACLRTVCRLTNQKTVHELQGVPAQECDQWGRRKPDWACLNLCPTSNDLTSKLVAFHISCPRPKGLGTSKK